MPAEIVVHYEQETDEDRRITEGLGELELIRAREVICRHLPRDSQRVLDVGGATGVHARWLAGQGHVVHLVDPIARHVEAARGLATEGLQVSAELGDARSLRTGADTFDAALLFGPLYHLTERVHRVAALREAARVLKPSGLLFVAAISRFAALFHGLGNEFLFDPVFRAMVEHDLRDGQHRNPEHRTNWFTTAYFHHPDELTGEVSDGGFDVVELVGLEGLAGYLPQLAHRWDDPSAREAILYAARAVEREPTLLGLSPHLLCVARPRA
jgi:SAM-dependent methyltransferase